MLYLRFGSHLFSISAHASLSSIHACFSSTQTLLSSTHTFFSSTQTFSTTCYGLTVRKVEGAGTEYIRKVNHVRRTIVIAFTSQYPRRQPSLYDYASRPSTLRSYSPTAGYRHRVRDDRHVPREHINVHDNVPPCRIEVYSNEIGNRILPHAHT